MVWTISLPEKLKSWGKRSGIGWKRPSIPQRSDRGFNSKSRNLTEITLTRLPARKELGKLVDGGGRYAHEFSVAENLRFAGHSHQRAGDAGRRADKLQRALGVVSEPQCFGNKSR